MRSLARFDEMRLSGLLPASGALFFVLQLWIDTDRDPRLALGIAAGFLFAGLVITRSAWAGRVLATAALATWSWTTADLLLDRPAAALAVWLGILGLFSMLWVVPGLPQNRRLAPGNVDPSARMARVRVSLRMTAVLAVLVALSRSDPMVQTRIAVVASLLVSMGWILRANPLQWMRRRRFVALLLVPLLAIAALWEVESASDTAIVLLTFLVLLATTFVRAPLRAGFVVRPSWWERLLENPARQLVITFLLLILLGTLLLGLPVAAADGTPVRFVDAAFTAVSAVCVTGLIVLDTPNDWSLWGQVILLVLIQLGGLGIMTFATAFLSAFGRRLSLRQEGAIAEMTTQENRLELYGAVRVVLGLTFFAELIGAAILLPRFLAAGDAWSVAAWRAVFTSVSSFCNAGFALQTDSLIGYASDPWVLHTVGVLIVAGGLSPAVVTSLFRGRGRVPVQTRLVLWTTGILLVVGAALFGASEWNNALAGMGTWDKLHSAWFQSVTLRTAGFNSVDFELIRPATVTLCVLWMFIGGSPGGTAGGIKTTTFALLALAVTATVRGHRSVTAFGRTIPHTTVYRATAVVTVGVLSLVLVLLAVQLTQEAEPVPALFEVASALGTVGLSMGTTGVLDTVGKIIIMVAMFAGRVGSLTLFVFLMARRSTELWRLPEETVDIG